MLPKFRNFLLVPRLMFAPGAISQTRELARIGAGEKPCVFLIDHFFEDGRLLEPLQLDSADIVYYVDTTDEPTTQQVDRYVARIHDAMPDLPGAIVGIGGGSTLDVAKPVSVVLTNGGSAEDYQGWDLPTEPGVYKVGVPTISGTGAEISRTTVLTGPTKKQGINSNFSLFDQIVMDPELLQTVPAVQRFYTGMDCYIHCVESITGNFINEFSGAFASKALEMCEKVFLGDASDADLMVASLQGGLSIVYSEVGVCHALSYGVSYAFGIHHGEANCIVFNQLDEFYGDYVQKFRRMLDRYQITLPKIPLTASDTDTIEKMIDVSLLMERPLCNALGDNWKSIFTRDKAREMFLRMAE